MSMTSVSLSSAIRPARSAGSSGGAAAGAAAGWRGGVHNTFGAGAVPATARTPGVPQPSSSPEAATPRVTGSNAREAGTLRPGTSGGRVAYRASIVLCAKGLGRGRGSHYTHTPRRSWTIPCREERRHVGRVTRAARSVAVGSAFLQDPRARGRGHRRRQGAGRQRAGEARETPRGGRPAADPARPVGIPRGGARPVTAPRPSRNGGGA